MRLRSGLLLALLLTGDYCLHADILYSVTDLGTLGGNFSQGNDLNNAGQVTGTATMSTGIEHAFLYTNGQMVDLGAWGGGCCSIGNGLNDVGQVGGEALTSTGDFRAFLYTNGQVTDLGTLGGRDSFGGRGINNAGQVTGDAATSIGIFHAFLYTNGQMVDLGTLGGRDSVGNGLNNLGQVTGTATTSTGLEHAFLYTNGQMVDLNDLIDPELGITLSQATAINNQGQIVANSVNGNSSRAYLLTPIPEPSTLALFGVALLGLGVWAGVRRTRA